MGSPATTHYATRSDGMDDRELNAHLRCLDQALHVCRNLPPEMRARIKREVRAVYVALLVHRNAPEMRSSQDTPDAR